MLRKESNSLCRHLQVRNVKDGENRRAIDGADGHEWLTASVTLLDLLDLLGLLDLQPGWLTPQNTPLDHSDLREKKC